VAHGPFASAEARAKVIAGGKCLARLPPPALDFAAQRVGYLVGFASFHLPRIIPQTSARMQAHMGGDYGERIKNRSFPKGAPGSVFNTFEVL
jgi:hypothetical protein